MTFATHLRNLGVEVLHLHGERIKLVGLDRLPEVQARAAIDFARQNKARLLEELGKPTGLPACLCLGCGKLFTPSNASKVYCQAKCSNTMHGLLQ